MAGFVTITPLTIGADGSGTTQNTVQAAVNDLAGKTQTAINGVTNGRGFPQILAQSAVSASVTGTLTETTLATIAIPAGSLGANGRLRITSMWSWTNNANAKTLRTRLAGSSLVGSSQTINTGLTMAVDVFAQNSTSSQRTVNANNGTGSVGGAMVTTNADMTAQQNITLTGTLGNTADTITLEAYSVEILNP